VSTPPISVCGRMAEQVIDQDMDSFVEKLVTRAVASVAREPSVNSACARDHGAFPLRMRASPREFSMEFPKVLPREDLGASKRRLRQWTNS
jgi:hypothetical protein